MTILSNAAVAAIVSLCLPSIATAATAAPMRQPVNVRVSHAGLDLSRGEDRQRMTMRIARAARSACGTDARDLGEQMDAARCRREMMADADVKLAAIAARGQLLASATR